MPELTFSSSLLLAGWTGESTAGLQTDTELCGQLRRTAEAEGCLRYYYGCEWMHVLSLLIDLSCSNTVCCAVCLHYTCPQWCMSDTFGWLTAITSFMLSCVAGCISSSLCCALNYDMCPLHRQSKISVVQDCRLHAIIAMEQGWMWYYLCS